MWPVRGSSGFPGIAAGAAPIDDGALVFLAQERIQSNQQLLLHARSKCSRRYLGTFGRYRFVLGRPVFPAAVQHANLCKAPIAHGPPDAPGEHVGIVIVEDDEIAFIYTERLEGFHGAGFIGDGGGGKRYALLEEMLRPIKEDGAWNVTCRVVFR